LAQRPEGRADTAAHHQAATQGPAWQLGDVEPVGEGVFEMREHFGPGWRLYYVQHGELVIVMLGGGDKSTQQTDIWRAIALAKSLED
jgi:putative addiction module killer protein